MHFRMKQLGERDSYWHSCSFPQIAVAIGVLTSSWLVRVCRFCGFVVGGGAVTQGVVGGVVWCVLGSGFADPRPGCHHTGCRWRCNLLCVGVRGLQISRRVSVEVSSDACTGGDSQFYLYINFHFCLVIFYLYLYFGLFLARNISIEKDLSCESAWNKLQKIADTIPCYLGPMHLKNILPWGFVPMCFNKHVFPWMQGVADDDNIADESDDDDPNSGGGGGTQACALCPLCPLKVAKVWPSKTNWLHMWLMWPMYAICVLVCLLYFVVVVSFPKFVQQSPIGSVQVIQCRTSFNRISAWPTMQRTDSYGWRIAGNMRGSRVIDPD